MLYFKKALNNGAVNLDIILKSNIEKIKQQHTLKKNIELFSNNLTVSFQGHLLSEYFAGSKYSVPK